MIVRSHQGNAPRRRLLAVAAPPALLAGLLLAALAPVMPVAAATPVVSRTWTATIGTSGTASVAGYVDGRGWLAVHLTGLTPGSIFPIRLVRGTCARPGTTIINFSASVAAVDGRLNREGIMSAAGLSKIWGVDRVGTGYLAIQIGTGPGALCGDLRYPVVTRVIFPAIRISLAVIRQNNTAFPYCGVAMYLPALHQPAEPGVTMIYAHARTGMFLPLLTASQVNNGAALIGQPIQVYTSDSKLYVYTVVKVQRHVTSLDLAFAMRSRMVWLQTSEGPFRYSTKLFVLSRPSSVSATTYAAAHPVAHPYTCAG